MRNTIMSRIPSPYLKVAVRLLPDHCRAPEDLRWHETSSAMQWISASDCVAVNRTEFHMSLEVMDSWVMITLDFITLSSVDDHVQLVMILQLIFN
jgi:hypothetical protein